MKGSIHWLINVSYLSYKRTIISTRKQHQKTNWCKKFALSRWLSFRFSYIVNICKYWQIQWGVTAGTRGLNENYYLDLYNLPKMAA